MSNLSDKYSQILADIEKNISNSDEKKYVIKRVEDLSSIYMELIDRVTKSNNDRLDNIEKQQKELNKELAKVKSTVDLIKNDIYEEDSYDFEIVCPYCNHEFVADVDAELKEEVECPECHNVIELNWNEDEEGCGGCDGTHCHGCGENHNNNKESEDNEDDM